MRSLLPALLAATAALASATVHCQLRLAADTPLWLGTAPAAPVDYQVVDVLRQADGRLVLDLDYAVGSADLAAAAETALRDALSGALGGAAVVVLTASQCEACDACPDRCECADAWVFPCGGGQPPEVVRGCAAPACAAPGMPPLCGAVDPHCEPDPDLGGEGVALPLAGDAAAFLCTPACTDDEFGSQAFPGESGAAACARLLRTGVTDHGSAEAACAAAAPTAPVAGMLLRQLCPVACGSRPARCGPSTLLPLRASAVGVSGLLSLCVAGSVLSRVRGGPAGPFATAGART